MKHKFGERLRQLRKENDISAEKLAQILDINKSTISRYETGKRDPYMPFVQKIAAYFNVSIDWLSGESEIREPGINTGTLDRIFEALPDQGKIELVNYAKYILDRYTSHDQTKHILGQTAAGQPLEYVDSFIEGAENAPENADFGLTVKGDSMEPLIKNGSTVWVKKQPVVENGEIAIVEIDGAVTCKKVYKRNGHLELHSINPKYKPMVISKGDVRIVGKVIL